MDNAKSARYALMRMILPVLVLFGHAAVMYTADGAIPPAQTSAFLE